MEKRETNLMKSIDKKTHNLLCVYLDIYINRTKIKIGMPDFNPRSNFNYDKFNKDFYNYSKQKKNYNNLFHKALHSQIKNSYRHTVDFSDLKKN